MSYKLFIPGPVEVSEKTYKAMATPIVGHRSKDFVKLVEDIMPRLKQLFYTNDPVFLSTSSSWGVMEGAIRNVVKKGVLNCCTGAFADKWYDVSKRCGKNAGELKFDWGKPVDPEALEKELSTPSPITYNPPFIIKTNSQRSADIYAMRYARRKGIRFSFLTLKEDKWRQIFQSQPSKNQVFYITNLEELKKSEMKEFLEMILKYSCIVSIISNDKVPFPQVVDISSYSNTLELGGDILSVREYERIIISKFESRYPDIELAKKLGMSRKSLWEKRKRYGLLRTKHHKES